MSRPLATILVVAAIASSGCGGPQLVSALPPKPKVVLLDLLTNATLDPAPANAPVLALIYTLPKGSSAMPIEVRPVHSGRLPPWTTRQPLHGTDALGKAGVYVGVFSLTARTIRFLARVGDPRDVRGESLHPASSAVFVRTGSGTYSVRVPFVPNSVTVGFEVNGAQQISVVDYSFNFGPSPPPHGGWQFKAVPN